MSRYVIAVRFDRAARAASKQKRTPFALDYASWHAHLAGRKPLTVPTPGEPARVVHLASAA